MSQDNPHGMERCAARDQATADKPCWGRWFLVFDEGLEACEGHFDGMLIAGEPCDLDLYRPKPKE
jgi:hypothetical protein